MAVGSRLTHVIESQQFSRSSLEELFARTEEIKQEPHRFMARLNGQVMAALFYEPSTRTRLSFEAAMMRLGGWTMGTDNAREFSSTAKGETLEDTIRIVSGYADVIVLRHNEEGAAKRAAAVSTVPIINAGDGPGQHPTQALLDIYTIKDELNKIDGIRVAMVGDLANGRTARSLTYLLSKFKDIKIWFVAPPQVRMRDDIKAHLTEHHIPWVETADLDSVLPEMVDVVYQTRIQKERFADPADYQALKGIYRIDREIARVDEEVRDSDAPPAPRWTRSRRRSTLTREPPISARPTTASMYAWLSSTAYSDEHHREAAQGDGHGRRPDPALPFAHRARDRGAQPWNRRPRPRRSFLQGDHLARRLAVKLASSKARRWRSARSTPASIATMVTCANPPIERRHASRRSTARS